MAKKPVKKKIFDYEKEVEKTQVVARKRPPVNKKKKRKGRIRFDRIFLVLFIFVMIIYSIIFTKNFMYNRKIYKSITKSSEVKFKNNIVKLNNKTLNKIHKKSKTINVKYNDYVINIDSKKIKNNLDFNIESYNEKIDNPNFNNSKALYMKMSNTLKKSNKIKVILPKYLYSNTIVDIYGITKDDEIEIIKKTEEVKNKSVKFNLNKKYEKYFITYVKVTSIEPEKEIEVVKNEIVSLNVKYLPSTATKKEVEYINIGDEFVLREKFLVARKEGKYKVTISNKECNMKKDVKIDVKKNENVIEKKNGLTYINGIIVVNKTYSVSKDYDPGGLKEEALSAYEVMKKDASRDGIKLWIASGYRSYSTQKELYEYYVKHNGQKKADTFSARAGYSEHQTGLAMDLNIVDSSFEGTKEAIWLEKNCYKYGFIIRYPKGKESITGYKYEPWHIRYLGKENALKLYNSGLTLEEYLDIDSKYDE